MITKITGILTKLYDERALLEHLPFEYEVLVSEYTRRQLQGEIDKPVSLYTIQYIEGSQQGGKMVPRLLGFQTEAEREFFDLFCCVDGVGTRKALRAMVRPVREIATAIEEQNTKFLGTLPGIGAAMAERIVAKLRRKVPKFALMAAQACLPDVRTDVVSETYEALLSLGHNESDARRLIDAVATTGDFKNSSELIQAIYQNTR